MESDPPAGVRAVTSTIGERARVVGVEAGHDRGPRRTAQRGGHHGVGEVHAVAYEQRLHLAQEHAGFSALDNAVIVSAGEGHHFADAQDGAGLFGRALIFGRIIDGSSRDDGALAGHEPRVGGHSADGAGVRE